MLFVSELPIVFHQTGLTKPQRAMLQKQYSVENNPTSARQQQIADEMKVPYAYVNNWYEHERAEMFEASKGNG